MSRAAWALLPALLAALLATGCSVDPDELLGFPDGCDVHAECVQGYTCEEGRCVLAAGAACEETRPAVSCERTLGVCAGAARVCAGGQVERTCSAASYGEQYEEAEQRCDGLDNDCDGVTDAQSFGLDSVGTGILTQLLQRPVGVAALSLEFSAEVQPTRTLRYHALGADFSEQAAPVTLLPPSPSDEGLVVLGASGATSAVVLWQTLPGQGAPRQSLVRVAHPAGGAPQVAAGPRALEAPPGARGTPRLALSADETRILVAWALDTGVSLQQLDAALAPVGEPLTFSPAPVLPGGGPFPAFDVAAGGAGGFTVAWASERTGGFAVNLRDLGASGTRTVERPGAARGLRLLSGAGGVRAVWLRSRPEGGSAVEQVDAAGTQAPTAALELPGEPLTRLDTALDPTGALLLSYPRGTGSDLEVVLRAVSPAGAVQERPLRSRVPFWSTQLTGASAGERPLAIDSLEARAVSLQLCSLR